MTKSEYREYIASEAWRERRRKFLRLRAACWRCGIPRWLAVIVYDQDLHVHHKSYARVGSELDTDLEQLCRRCHELETFGKSDLVEVAAPLDIDQFVCRICGDPMPWPERQGKCEQYRYVSQSCSACTMLYDWEALRQQVDVGGSFMERWEAVLQHACIVMGVDRVLKALADAEQDAA